MRDLIGYGPAPPHPRWPGNARVAVNFVINYEEGAEYTVLNGDARSETLLSEAGAGAPKLQARDLNMESMYEYGSRAGIWRVLRAFRSRGVVPTAYAVGLALEKNPLVAEAFVEAGCDIVAHGWRWIDYDAVAPAVESEHMRQCIAAIARLTGARPLGWYTGRPSSNTRALVVREGGFRYDSDGYADDLPYWTDVDGSPHLVVPHAFDSNDSRTARNQDLPTADHLFAYLCDSFDVLYEEGAEAPKMLTVSLHARLIGRPGRVAALTRFLDHILKHDRVWICRRIEIAEHWHANLPPRR